jgi:glycosyltransferase involved in cell wall biosynthesis
MGCYNDAQYLHESIPSVLAQTEPNIGLLLLDNGSTDESYNILRDYYRKDHRIRLVRSNKNLSSPEATNFGWNYAMELWPLCRWFLGMGSDDIIDEDYVEAILHVANMKPEVNCIFSPARFIDHPEKDTYVYPPYVAHESHLRLMVPGWRAFTKGLWKALGGEWTEIGRGSDWEWIVRASVKGLLRPHQMQRSYLAMRIRTERTSESDLVDKQALQRRLNYLAAGGDA